MQNEIEFAIKATSTNYSGSMQLHRYTCQLLVVLPPRTVASTAAALRRGAHRKRKTRLKSRFHHW